MDPLEPLLEELGDPCDDPGEDGAEALMAGDVLLGLPFCDPWGDADLFLRWKMDFDALFSPLKMEGANISDAAFHPGLFALKIPFASYTGNISSFSSATFQPAAVASTK